MRRSLRWFGFVGAMACLLAGSPAAATPAAVDPTAVVAPAAASAVAAPSAATGAARAPGVQQEISYDRYARYVTYVYEDLLGRQPEAGGLSTWVSALSRVPRSQVATSISSSREYRERLVRRAYDRYLNRVPDTAGLKNWADALDRGWTVSTIESGFLASQEYYLRAGGTPDGWVRKLYRAVLGRTAAPSEVGHWVRVLAGGYTRAQVALGFLLSTEHLTTVVDGYYVQLLDRHIDPAGRRTWVSALQAGRQDEEIIAGIIGSDEYWNRTATYPLSDLVLSPSAPEIAAGASQAFTVRALGRGDDLGDVTARAVVTIDGQPCPGAVCTATPAGVHVVQAALGETWTAVNLTVRPGPLDHVTITPATVTIADGASYVYAAEGFDEYGNAHGDVTSQVTFAVDGNTAACDGARCRPVGTGEHTVTAVGFTGSVTLTMSPPGPQAYTLWGWGTNIDGTLGPDAPANALAPIQVSVDDHWVQVASGTERAIGLKSDGSVWTWGNNTWCGLGTGGPDRGRDRPEQVGTGTDWVQIAAAGTTTFALRADGTLWGWGDERWSSGLGAGTGGLVCHPVQIGVGRTWRSVTTSGYVTAAIATDGSLWAWGKNNQGQLGDGTKTERLLPTFIDAGPWAQVEPEMYHTVGLKEDGTIWAWGMNNVGQLGIGTTTSSTLPVLVAGAAGWVQVETAQVASYAIDADGVLWRWGKEDYLASEPPRALVPEVFDSTHLWTALDASFSGRTMLASDGTLWSWGKNASGQLGDGTTADRVLPVPVAAGAGWVDVSTDPRTTLALRDPGAAP